MLILGSGNLVHNLHTYAWGRHPQEPYDWALRFEAVAKQSMLERNYQRLIAYEQLGPDAMLSDSLRGPLSAAAVRARQQRAG